MHDVQSAIDDALARAVVYRTLSMAFLPPGPERLESIGAGDGFAVTAAALRRMADRTADGTPLETAAARLSSLESVDAERLSSHFVALFGHTARGSVCACECEYGPDNGFRQPQQLADIAGYYLAFGLRAPAGAEVRLDHIACECEFMDALCRKEAYLAAGFSTAGRRLPAAEAGDEADTIGVTRQAARTFLRDHLGRFGRAFAARVASEDAHPFFRAMAVVMGRWIESECARAGVEAGPVDLPLRPDADDAAPMACGTNDDLIQIQRRP